MKGSRKTSAKKWIAWALITSILAFSNITIGQTFSFSVVKNGEFTNLIDEDGNLAFTIVQNAQFTTFLDKDGNFTYALVQNGQFGVLVDQNGGAVFNVVRNGRFLLLTPVPEEKPRRSEINKGIRQRAEIAAIEVGIQKQQKQVELNAVAQKLREELRNDRENFKVIGFTDDELARFGRVLTKFEESIDYLNKHPEPIRRLTGIAESNADFEKRYGRWMYGARPHLRTLKLCHEEVTGFMEKYNRLTGN